MAISKPTKTYTFSNGTTADATEVNSDFDTIYSKVNECIDDINSHSTTIAADLDQAVKTSSSPTFVKATLSQSTGTAPLTVTSTTKVTNLNADKVDGYDFNQDVQSTASPEFVKMTLSQATGTAPLTVSSTTKVTNLNADLLDDQTGSYYLDCGNFTGTLSDDRLPATITSDITGNVTGNADTATKLATARAIELSGDVTGTANFDGSAAINITATVGDNTHSHNDTTITGVAVGALPAGTVIGFASATTTAAVSCTGAIPDDDTKPQNTEGTEVITLAYTPKSASSVLLIEFRCSGKSSNAALPIVALFVDSGADAIAAAYGSYLSDNWSGVIAINHYVTSGSTSARTYKVRIGVNAGAFQVNAVAGGTRVFGGVASTNLTITEIAQ